MITNDLYAIGYIGIGLIFVLLTFISVAKEKDRDIKADMIGMLPLTIPFIIGLWPLALLVIPIVWTYAIVEYVRRGNEDK